MLRYTINRRNLLIARKSSLGGTLKSVFISGQSERKIENKVLPKLSLEIVPVESSSLYRLRHSVSENFNTMLWPLVRVSVNYLTCEKGWLSFFSLPANTQAETEAWLYTRSVKRLLDEQITNRSSSTRTSCGFKFKYIYGNQNRD